MMDRRRFMDKVTSSQKSLTPSGVPLYKRMIEQAESKNRQWYEQFSRKELMKFSVDTNSNSRLPPIEETDLVIPEEGRKPLTKRAYVPSSTFTVESNNRLKMAPNRHTEMNINPNLIKLDKVEEIEKINYQIKALESSLATTDKESKAAADKVKTLKKKGSMKTAQVEHYSGNDPT
jgi:hypothetical protein